MTLIDLAERGLLPDALIRVGIRRLLEKRLAAGRGQHFTPVEEFADQLRQSPLAIETGAANAQHYEVPAAFFQQVLGPRLKYSCCCYPTETTTLAEAEVEMLQLTCERAQIEDGMHLLELGCGWGSLTLWMAENYPQASITAVSNSSSQRDFILQRAREKEISNLEVITADMRDFETNEQFDRVLSVEMFEHMRNYELLLERIRRWLTPGGKLFVHIFCHRDRPYLFEVDGKDDWMSRHFFTGGTMPSEDLFELFDRDLHVTGKWRHNGMDYWRTCEDWLLSLDASRKALLTLLEREMTAKQAKLALQRWRIFFMACAELFRYRHGSEWFVSHYLFESRKDG